MKNAESTAKNIAIQIEKTLAGEKMTASAFASGNLVITVGEEVQTKGIDGAAAAIQPLRQEMKGKLKLLGAEYLGVFVTDATGTLFGAPV